MLTYIPEKRRQSAFCMRFLYNIGYVVDPTSILLLTVGMFIEPMVGPFQSRST